MMKGSDIDWILNRKLSLEELGRRTLHQAGKQIGAEALGVALSMWRANEPGAGTFVRYMLPGYTLAEKNYPLSEDLLEACLSVPEVLEDFGTILDEAYVDAWLPMVTALCKHAKEAPDGVHMKTLIKVIPEFGWGILDVVIKNLDPTPELVEAVREQCRKITSASLTRFDKWAAK